MGEKAHLEGPRGDGTFKWCVFPCQERGADGEKIDRQCRVPIHPQTLGYGASWTATGPSDAPTINPSINCNDDKCWHGYIVDGEVRNPRDG